MSYLTPRQIVEELDKYIIGQDKAKRTVAIALRNRYRRSQLRGRILDNAFSERYRAIIPLFIKIKILYVHSFYVFSRIYQPFPPVCALVCRIGEL